MGWALGRGWTLSSWGRSLPLESAKQVTEIILISLVFTNYTLKVLKALISSDVGKKTSRGEIDVSQIKGAVQASQ